VEEYLRFVEDRLPPDLVARRGLLDSFSAGITTTADYSFAGSAHFDSLMILPMVAGILLLTRFPHENA